MRADRSERLRWVVLVALVVTGVGGTIGVYFIATHNRNVDRTEVLRYETQVTAPLSDLRGVVASVAKAAAAFRNGKVDAQTYVRTLGVYEAALRLDARRIDATVVPIAFGAHARMFAPVPHAYLDALGLFRRAASAPNRASALDAAGAEAAHAAKLYHEAAEALQLARARLGLPRSANVPDPAAS